MSHSNRMVEVLEQRTMLSADSARLPIVNITVSSPTGWEAKRSAARVVVQRTGNGAAASSLKVAYAISGTATNGVDYRRLKGHLVFAVNQTSVQLNITPIADILAEGNESVVLALRPGKDYALGKPRSASLTIVDGATKSDWPAAPFSGANSEGILYVNQNGAATITGRTISPAGDFDGYQIGYDDPGGMDVHTTGNVATQVAYYENNGPPARIADGNAGFSVQVPDDKRNVFLAVRAIDRNATGAYALIIAGPAPMIEKMDVAKKNDFASSGSDISGVNDFDYYSFKTTRGGNWTVKAIPDSAKNGRPRLDATLNVFDSRGKPLGGSALKTINAGGPGVTERWTGVGLQAGKTYYFAVDGHQSSLGGYGVSVELTAPRSARAKARNLAPPTTSPTKDQLRTITPDPLAVTSPVLLLLASPSCGIPFPQSASTPYRRFDVADAVGRANT